MKIKEIIVLILMLLTAYTYADQKGEAIARKTFDLKEPDDQYSTATMVLIDKRNNKKVRKIEMFSKKTEEGNDSFVKFLEPADVKGTTFLTIAHKKGSDEQRLYLPSLKKIRRISSSGKKGSFMGSDLNYYDMEDRDYEDCTYNYIKDEIYNNMNCSVIEMVPLDEDAPYSKMIAWVNNDNYFTYKVECYDKNSNELSKTIVIDKVQEIDGILIAQTMIVDNHLENHKTVMLTENIKINIGLDKDIFTVNNLTR